MALQDSTRNDLHLTQFDSDLFLLRKTVGMPQSTYGNNHLVLLCFSWLNLQAEKQEATPEVI